MRVVIIGGVAGGMSAATRLRRLDESAEIIVLERSGHVSYANCGLPYYVVFREVWPFDVNIWCFKVMFFNNGKAHYFIATIFKCAPERTTKCYVVVLNKECALTHGGNSKALGKNLELTYTPRGMLSSAYEQEELFTCTAGL